MNKLIRNTTLALLLSAFGIGWQSAPETGLVYPVNMTLAGDRLFVSDGYTGIHVFDVADPQSPGALFTIPLHGNRGTAVKGDIVYANDYNRLLVIKVDGNSYDVVKTIKTDYAYGDGGMLGVKGPPYRGGFGCMCEDAATPVLTPESSTGTGSSYATFAVIDDYLYYIDYTSIVTMDISTPENPKEISRTRIDWTIDTLYPMSDLLFIGGSQGMFVFDRSNPSRPQEIGRVQHLRACDPVVAAGDVAFVTLRGGGNCGGDQNVLLCVDMTNPAVPSVIAERPMDTPYGLALNGPFLYVSTGLNGFELVDVARPNEPGSLAKFPGWGTRDFIWSGDTLFALGFEDLRIFDVRTPGEPALLSTIGSVAADPVVNR